jgi:tripartite-type tricarboxylate transporter receptor subunit TctC
MTHAKHAAWRSAGRLALCTALTLTFALSGTAHAAYPDKPIKLILPVAPGGATDIVARRVAQHMSTTLKQQVLVENQAGGGGNIAATAVARAPADGYTLLMSATALVAAPYLFNKLPFDADKSFVPVTQVVTFYNLLVTNSGSRFKTLKEYIAEAKDKKVAVGGGNLGGQSWVMTVKLNKMAGTKLEYVAYKGAGPAITDAIGGHIDSVLGDPAALKAFIADGRLRPLGVTTPKRARAFPDVPAISEVVPGYEQEGWIGIFAPAGTPKDAVQRIYQAVAEALADPAIRQKLIDEDFGVVGSTPEEFGALYKRELDAYGKIISDTGVKLD